MLHYCKRCGRIVIMFESDEKICDCCKNIVYPIPDEYCKDKYSIDPDKKDEFIEKYIKPSPEFDPYLFEHRDEILARENMKVQAALARGASILQEQSRVPKCPTCGSTNIRRMSGVERGASIAAFGIFSKKINKSFKCGNCGYTW